MKTTALLRAGIVLTCSTAITRTSPDSTRCTSDRFWIPHLAKNGWQPVFAGRICQHCFVIAYISKTTQGYLDACVDTWGLRGNWFEDRCRVNVRDGFVRKRILPSGGVAFLPDKRGYPCRHLPERIVRQVCEGGQTCKPIWSGPNYWTLLGLVKIFEQ